MKTQSLWSPWCWFWAFSPVNDGMCRWAIPAVIRKNIIVTFSFIDIILPLRWCVVENYVVSEHSTSSQQAPTPIQCGDRRWGRRAGNLPSNRLLMNNYCGGGRHVMSPMLSWTTQPTSSFSDDVNGSNSVPICLLLYETFSFCVGRNGRGEHAEQTLCGLQEVVTFPLEAIPIPGWNYYTYYKLCLPGILPISDHPLYAHITVLKFFYGIPIIIIMMTDKYIKFLHLEEEHDGRLILWLQMMVWHVLVLYVSTDDEDVIGVDMI